MLGDGELSVSKPTFNKECETPSSSDRHVLERILEVELATQLEQNAIHNL